MARLSQSICETELRRYIREVENDLSTCQEQEKLVNILSIVRLLANAFPDKFRINEENNIGVISCCGLQNLKEHEHIYKQLFAKLYYSRIVTVLLDKLSIELISKFPKDKIKTHIDGLFIYGPGTNSFLVLTHAVTNSRPCFKLHKCVSLLEDFLLAHRLAEVLKATCSCSVNVHNPDIPLHGESSRILWDQLLVAVVSLPDNMANTLQGQNSELFLPANYIPLIGKDLMHTLQSVHDMITHNTDCSLEFVSRLFGKLCMAGYGDVLWDTILPTLYKHVQTDYIWCRICQRILTGLPDRCLESAILPLLNKIPWWGAVGKFLGDCVVDNSRVRHVLCNKLLLHRFSEQVLLLQNVVGYLASSHTRRQLYFQVMKNLLQVWGDVSAVKHTSYEQHLYICRALVICIGHLQDKDTAEVKGDFHRLLMPAIQCHIACADVKIRTQGMVVAEILTKALDPTGPQLKFEYERDAEVDHLFSLLEVPREPDMEEIEKKLGSTFIENAATCCELETKETRLNESNNATTQAQSDLDSDDDLEPFDMSHDLPVTKAKTPKYIRDCMEGLICSDDPDRIEVCLKTTERLVRANRHGLSEIAAELCKVLLHLSDNFAITDFIVLRFGALVAVIVQCPEQSAVFLTAEFYERNYNLRQRMDVLEVLAAAAQELSSPEQSDKVKATKPVEEVSEKSEVSNWREIVEKRIESKTRRFAKGPRQPPMKASVNRFSSVAGFFFYPLMKNFDRKESTLDLLGEDMMILGRLVFTLGIILYAALHSPNCQRMGTTLLEFTWCLRFHTDPYIRQSVLFATSMIILVVPCHFLLSDLQPEIMETKSWLQDVVEKDSNTECKKLAIQALVLLENSLKNEFDTGGSIS